jgi:fructose-1,6-bisphosphatase-3
MSNEEVSNGTLIDGDLAVLWPLARQFPGLDVALAEIARLSAELTLPKETTHVISDVHGDDVKLRHVINNASGAIRPLVEGLFGNDRSPAEIRDLLTLIFYPKETLEEIEPTLQDTDAKRNFARKSLNDLFVIVRNLARRRSVQEAEKVFPPEYAGLLSEILNEPLAGRGPEYLDAILDVLVRHNRVEHFLRLTVRVVRNLAVDELVLAGDCWDRGARGDRVVETLMHLPNMSFIWGNHDTAWLGACLGSRACIAHVLRISIRYRRLSQLEEGYGITLQSLEHLVRTVYKDDPADCYKVKGDGLREPLTMARLQKAAAIMQFKLEGQLIARNPEFGLDHRRLLHHIDYKNGTITIDDKVYPLRDTHFPTINPDDPYALSPEENVCLERLRKSFLSSQKLWDQMRFLVSHGSMSLIRDNHLIFHGCVAVDEKGEFLPMSVDGRPYTGKALFAAIETVISRVLDNQSEKDRDLMWYLWCGPKSPLFGKDRITTLENDLVEAKETHHETKNPYFSLIHEAWFCEKVLSEFGVDPVNGLIVNGHVPVKLEQGESPMKRSGKAITIDGAFSSAYGDHGYTLVLKPSRTLLATHHHFESVEAAVHQGVDIIPTLDEVRVWPQPHRVADTERGAKLRNEIRLLEKLVDAYRLNKIRPA